MIALHQCNANIKPTMATVAPPTKKSKKQMTSYWGISLTNDIFQNNQIKQILENNAQLIPLEKIHSTLLYVGKKENENETQFEPHEKRECTLKITHFGHTDKAMALRVESITFDDDSSVPSFAEIQHVTLALRNDTKAKDSVETLKGGDDASLVKFDEPIILKGAIKRYLY